jgi:hypothetical protein
LTVFGQGFVHGPGLTCVFGTTHVEARWVSSEIVICRTPASMVGSVRMWVSNIQMGGSGDPALDISHDHNSDGSTTSTPLATFEFHPAVSVMDVRPSSVLAGHGRRQPVVVIGANFINSTSLTCAFGDSLPPTPGQFVSTNLVICRTPTLQGWEARNASGVVKVCMYACICMYACMSSTLCLKCVLRFCIFVILVKNVVCAGHQLLLNISYQTIPSCDRANTLCASLQLN